MDGDVDDDSEDDDVPVRAMKDEIEGEENATGERYNEVGERIEPFNLQAEEPMTGFRRERNFVWKRGDAGRTVARVHGRGRRGGGGGRGVGAFYEDGGERRRRGALARAF